MSEEVISIEQALRREASPAKQVELLERELLPRLAPGSVDWVFDLAEIAAQADVSLEAVRRATSNLAWQARDIGQRMPAAGDWQRCNQAPDPLAVRRILAYAHGFRLRFDFRFEELAKQASGWLTDVPDDGLIQALAAFAALGAHSERAEPLLRHAMAAVDYDSVCRWTCLHGLWFGTHLPDQADRIIELSDEMIGRGEDAANLYYWRAFALRRLDQLDAAVASIDRAIMLLPVGQNAVHQDYVRERELIQTTQLLKDQISALAGDIGAQLRDEFDEYLYEVEADLERHSHTAQRIVSESLLSLMEVLGLFVTLAGFLIGSGAIVFQAEGFWQQLAGIGLLLVGSVAFFLILRGVVRFRRSRPVDRGQPPAVSRGTAGPGGRTRDAPPVPRTHRPPRRPASPAGAAGRAATGG
jgi:hypothetical protein